MAHEDDAHVTEPQRYLHDRALYWPRGKVLGGTRSMNAMVYSRAHRCDYDAWRDLGNEGWGYADALPYYKKAEHNERGASDYHGVGGPLNVADLRTVNPLSRAFVDAGVEMDLPLNADFNGEDREGVGVFQVTQRDGKRCSMAVAYLKPALCRSDLTVKTHAQTTRLLFEGRRVIGLEYAQDGQTLRVRASREVILCGGAINSPQVLMLSGVGPADHLRSLGIPVVENVPGVGQNLQDHFLATVNFECKQPVSLAGAETIGNLASFLLFGKGMLTSNVVEAGAFIRTQLDLPAPDLEFMFAPTYYMQHGALNPKGHGFAIAPVLERPLSRGWISLRSSDPCQPPVIQPNYLADESDLQLLVQAIKYACMLAAMKSFDSFRSKEVWPGGQVRSDDDIIEWVRRTAEKGISWRSSRSL